MATVLQEETFAMQGAPTGRGGRGIRVRGSRRGRGRGRGRARSSSGTTTEWNKRDPTKGWRISSTSEQRLLSEDEFVRDVIEERARLFCSSAMEKLHFQRCARALPLSRAGTIVLFMDELLNTCLGWLNEFITLHIPRGSLPFLGAAHEIKLYDMYRFVSVLLLSHCKGFSLGKTIEILGKDNLETPSLELVRFISSHILVFSPTDRGNHGAATWMAQRDYTPRLTQFENTAFRQTCNIFVSPCYTMATLDDDLYGTRADDNQVKSLSSRKADREGHTADAIADALFRVTLMVRFRRRGISQSSNVSTTVGAVLEGRGERSLHGLILTADRGYGKESLMRELLRYKIGSIMIMPEHVLQSHPFIGKSFLDVMRNEDEFSGSENSSESSGEEDETVQQQSELNPNPGSTASALISRHFDRPGTFVLNDDSSEGSAAWTAVKTFKVRAQNDQSTIARTKVTAIIVRERGTDKFSRILRFMYSVPTNVAVRLESWIAVPKAFTLSGKLFLKRTDSNRICRPLPNTNDPKDVIERHVLANCIVLSIDQMCADWFVLLQFRVTGTSAGKIILSDRGVQQGLGTAQVDEGVESTLQKVLKSL